MRYFNTEQLADEIMKHVSGAANKQITNAPNLARVIFGVKAETIAELLKLKEFDLVCKAIDKLIEEGRVVFSCETGELTPSTDLEVE